MLLRFKIDDQGFRCLDSAIAATAISINYIKCHFDVAGTEWEDIDAICAIFKSATYNKHYEVMLDSNNNCFIDPEIYRRGGTIQVKLAGDKYIDESVVSSTSITPVVEFQIRDNVIIPTPTPSKYDVFVAEIEIARDAVDAAILDLAQRVANGEFDGKDGANITNITYNSDGTVTIDLSDGQQFTSVQSMKGEKGDRGDDGVGIASVVYGQDGTLLITMSDGTQYISPYSIKGEKGDKGDPGDKGDAFVYEDFTQEELDDLAEAATPDFGIGTVSTLAAGSQATATITGTPQNPALNLGIPKGVKGDTGAAAGFGTVTATVDANIGTPSVTVTPSGTDTSKNFNFEFHNLKGAKGDKGDKGDPGSGGGGSVTVDTEMSITSSNPVQNKVIKSYVDIGLANKINVGDALCVVEFTYDSANDKYTASKSANQIYEAWTNGKPIVGVRKRNGSNEESTTFIDLLEVGSHDDNGEYWPYATFSLTYLETYSGRVKAIQEVMTISRIGPNLDDDEVTSSNENVDIVPATRTINGMALSSNITLTASDVGALPSSTVIPTYTAGTGIDITNGVISIDLDNAEGSNY